MKTGKSRGKKTTDSLRKRAEALVEERMGGMKPKALSAEEARRLIHELQTHQIELEIQNEDLRNTQLSLEEAKSKYADLYDFAPVGYFTFDRNGLILEANLAGASLLGVERSRLIAKPFTLYISRDHQDAFYLHRTKVLETGQRQTCEIELKRTDGAVFYALLESIIAGRDLCRTAVSDIRERRRAEDRITLLTGNLTDNIAELNVQNEELRRTQMELEATRSEYFNLFNFAPVGYFTFDEEGNVLAANTTGASQLGIERASLLRQPFTHSVIEEDRPLFLAHLKEVFGSAEKRGCELRLTGKDRALLFVRIESVALDEGFEGRARCLTAVLDITERKRAEEELERLASFPRLNPNPIVEVDLAGTVNFINPAAMRLFPDIKTAGVRHPFLADLESFVAQQENENATRWREIKIGKTWYHQTFYLVRKDRVMRIYGFDITNRKRLEDALRASVERYRSFIEVTGQLGWTTNADGEVVEDIPSWRAYTGQTYDEIRGWGWSKALHPDDLERTTKRWKKAVAEKSPYEVEYRIRRHDGIYRYFMTRGIPLIKEDGTIREWVGACIDITERKRAEIALRESEQIYRAIGETIDFGIWICDTEGRNIYASESFLHLVGLTQDQCSNFGWGDVLHPDDAERTITAWKECVRTGGTWDIEHRFRGVDGTWYPVLARGVPVRDEEGAIKCWAGINLDLRRVKQVEEALRKLNDELETRVRERTEELVEANEELEFEIAERRRALNALVEQSRILESFFEHSHTCLVFLDKDFNFIRVNEAYARACARKVSDFTGHNHFVDYPSDELRERFQRVIDTKEPYRVFGRPFVFPDHPEWGVTYWDLAVAPILDSQGAVDFLVLSLFDVSERKKAEEKLKLASTYNRSLIEASLDPLVTIDADGKIADVNSATEKVTGHPREELIGSDFSDYFTEPEKAREGYRRVFQEGLVHDFELAIRDRDGRVTPVLYNASVYRDGAGNIAGIFAAARDISERKETERRTNANNALLRLFSQIASRKEYLDAVVHLIHTWSGCRCVGIRIKNDQAQLPYESYIGFSQEFWEQENWLSVETDQCVCIRVVKGLPDPQERPAVTPYGSFYSNNTMKFVEGLSAEEKERYRGACIRQGFSSVAVIPIRYRGDMFGAIHLADAREGLVPLKSVEFIELISPLIGEALYRFSIEDDLLRNYEELRKSEKRLSEAQRIASLGNWEWDIRTNELHWSEEIYRIFGLDPKEFGATYVAFLNYVHPDDRELVKKAVNEALLGRKPYSTEHRLVLPDGSTKIVHEQGEVTFSDSGEPVRMVGTVQDITERKLVEERLRNSREQLRSLSAHLDTVREHERTSIAREIHDELGQALTALKMDISWLGSKYREHEPLAEKTRSMIQLVDSTIQTVRRISSELRPVVLDDLGLTAAIEWQAGEFQRRTGVPCSVRFKPDDITLDRPVATTIFRIFQEALTNVIRHAGATRVSVTLEEKGRNIELNVEDNGKGITEKERSDHKSFGLIGMRERAHHLGGEVRIVGAPDKGTSLFVTIPIGRKEDGKGRDL